MGIDTVDPAYYTVADGDGQTTAAREAASMWVATQNLPRSAAHPFYTRLNQVLVLHSMGRQIPEALVLGDVALEAISPPRAVTMRGSGPLYGALREFCSRCERRIAVGAHSAPARERSGVEGSPRATEPGSGAEPRSGLFRALAVVAALALAPSAELAQGATAPPGGEHDRQTVTPNNPPSDIGQADRAAPRTDANSMTAHAELLRKAKQGRIDVYFVGDSIVRRWGALDYPELLANWKQNFHGWNAANFGWGGDRTQNILWRLENGELDGVDPKVIVVLAGTNNVGAQPRDEQAIAEIARGLKAILEVCRKKAPNATIIVTAIFPRNDSLAVMPTIDRINQRLATFADGKRVRFLNINDRLADANGTLVEGVLNEPDKLHPTLKGYQIWADALKPIFGELLGPPAATDLAPPPTGDRAAAHRIR